MDALLRSAVRAEEIAARHRHEHDRGQLRVAADPHPVRAGAPEDWPAGASVTVADLPALPFVATPRASIRRELEDTELAAVGVTERTVVIEFGHPEAIEHAVRAGLGFH